MSEKSKVVIIGGTSDGIHSILHALRNADLGLVTVVSDEKTLHAELGEALFSDPCVGPGAQLGVSSLSEFSLGESTIDPLQDAIGSAEIACRSAQGETLEIMQAHLKYLLRIQLSKELSAAGLTIQDIEANRYSIEPSISSSVDIGAHVQAGSRPISDRRTARCKP